VSKFLTTLDLRLVYPWAHQGRGEWEFIGELHYYSDLLKLLTIIPIGFRYDRASVPRLPVAFALFGDRYARSAGVHDWYCRNGAIPRKVADKLFLEAMRVENEEEITALIADGADEEAIRERRGALEGQAQMMYAGVRIGSVV
jgi:hypothetical protein